MISNRHRSFIEQRQNGDTTDEEWLLKEDELFKHGYLHEYWWE